MTDRVLLYGATGQPAVVEVSGAEKMQLLLVEVAGMLLGQADVMTPKRMFGAIVTLVGSEKIQERWPQWRADMQHRQAALEAAAKGEGAQA